MLIISIVLILLAVVAFVICFKNDWDFPYIALWLIAASVVCGVAAIRYNFTDQRLTGYIYSSENSFGYKTSHIRFSEDAGVDTQPSFCVDANSEIATKIDQLTGSGKKVMVKVAPYLYMTNNPFDCGVSKNITVEEM